MIHRIDHPTGPLRISLRQYGVTEEVTAVRPDLDAQASSRPITAEAPVHSGYVRPNRRGRRRGRDCGPKRMRAPGQPQQRNQQHPSPPECGRVVRE